MPVTELAWVTSTTPGAVPPELLEAGRKGIELQSEWAAIYAPSTLPAGPPAIRGAALYQQRENKGILMITAHWDSVAQHEECIASELNRAAMESILAHIIPSELKLTHIDGVQMFPAETLEAGLLSVVRLLVKGGADSKTKVEETWTARVKKLLAGAAGLDHIAGWRIGEGETRDKGGSEEFVVVGAWKDKIALEAFVNGTWKHAHDWDDTWKDVVLETNVKTYDRVE